MKITMEHGSGGLATGQLIEDIFSKYFSNPILAEMEDCALVEGSSRLAMTTDSFVVTPHIYQGGDIGKLAICGTVNDLLMRGAKPKYITCGFILQEGLLLEELESIVQSMANTAKEANVTIVAGDTKVVEGNGGLFINTAGVGFVEEGLNLSAKNCEDGDVVLLSGTIGEHHATILSARMEMKNSIESDNAPLGEIVQALMESSVEVRAMRDVTRGGLATVLKEIAKSSGKDIYIEENLVPVSPQVKDFCSLLGLDPLYMGNEGKLVAIIKGEDKDRALEIIQKSKYGQDVKCIGEIQEGNGKLILKTSIGGKRNLEIMQGEGLPRIC